MDDSVPTEDEVPSRDPPLYDTAGISPGGQVYTNTEIGKLFYGGIEYLSEYGWHIVIVLVCVMIVWVKLGPTIREWWAKKKAREEELNFDPVKAERYEDGILRARERMQRIQDEKASEHQEKMEEKKAKDNEEKIQQWETFGVVGSKPKKPKPTIPSPSRRDYYPMGGHGGGGGYRPARRNVRGGG